MTAGKFFKIVLIFIALLFYREAFALPVDSIPDIAPSTIIPTDSISSVIPTDSISDISHTDSVTVKQRTPRKSSPVDIDDKKPQVTLHYYDKHGNPLEEPVKFLATLDTITKPKSKPIYPLLTGCSIGANFGDAIFMAAGQKYGSFDIWADLSIFNWIFPVIEAGIGFANSTPENGNFTYKGLPSFYTKVGVNYNFMYKNDPAYQVFLGARIGFSSFKYDIENISIPNGYWGETQTITLKGLSATAFYGEVLAGLKVKIVGPFSLGWTARFHMKMKVNSKSASTPWFIPGYGATSPFGFSVSAIYSFGQKKVDIPDIEPDK